MKKQDEERIKYIRENGDGYVTIQQDLEGKVNGQTEFRAEGNNRKPRFYPDEKKGGLGGLDRYEI